MDDLALDELKCFGLPITRSSKRAADRSRLAVLHRHVGS
jgi:hypothetical protein